MSYLTQVFILLTALECFYILYLQTFAITSSTAKRIFRLSEEAIKRPELIILFKNQGVYNGLLGIGLLYGWMFNEIELVRFLLIYLCIVALYGGLSSHKSILWKQGGLPMLTLLLAI